MAGTRLFGAGRFNEFGVAAAAGPINIVSGIGLFVNISGTAGPITRFGTTTYPMWKKIRVSGTTKLTYDATWLITPTGRDMNLNPGDSFDAISDSAGHWRIINFKAALFGGLGDNLIGYLLGANFNSTADQQIPMKIGNGGRFYRFVFALAYNPSINMTTAAGGIYTGAGKTGTAVVAATQTYALMNTVGASNQLLTISTAGAQVMSADPLYFSLTTPQGAAATADIAIFGTELP